MTHVNKQCEETANGLQNVTAEIAEDTEISKTDYSDIGDLLKCRSKPVISEDLTQFIYSFRARHFFLFPKSSASEM